MKLKNKKLRRIYACLIIVAMLTGMLPGSAWAASPGTQMDVLNNFVVELSSDPSTSARPSTFGTASDDGRVWVDKSVSVNGTQFDVTLSALAQEYIRTSTTMVGSQAAADVAMVLDMSLSMTADRITKMKDAVNKSIDIIMAANPRNRIGIYYYGLATGNTSGVPNVGTLFPLASYSTPQTGDNTSTLDRYITSNNQTITKKAGLTQKSLNGTTTTTTSQTIYTSSGTATQTGLYTAINALKTDIAGLSKSSEDTERVPYVLLLTDGEANRAYPNWYNSPPNGTEKAGSGASGTAEISALTVLTAAKLKQELKTAYSMHSGGKDVVWFNVAFGLTEGNNLATAFLKPSRLASATSGDEKSVYTQLTTLTTSAATENKKYGIGGTPGYLYASNYIYFISPNDLTKVDEALGDLSELIEAATQEKIVPIDQTNGLGEPLNLVITDVLGAGMELQSAPKMGEVTGTVKSVSGTVTTYKFGDIGTTVEYNSAKRELKWIIIPEEVPLIMFSNRQNPTAGNYSNANISPARLTYTVGLSDTYASGTFYSNEYVDNTASARFIPNADNPYYYKNITVSNDQIVSTPKVVGSEITPSGPKSSNTTGTAATVFANEWSVDTNGSNVFITKLGNNGKIAPKLKIEITPASGSVVAGEKVIYDIVVTNLTSSNISNVIVNDVLPSGLTVVNGSIKENNVIKPSETFPYMIGSVPANGSVVLTFEAAVPSNVTAGTQYINSATITSVGSTTFSTPAIVSSDKVTVTTTFSPSVITKLDGANYSGQVVTLWKDGVSKYTLTASDSVHSASGVTPGTYDIYVNGVNTGVQLSGSNANSEINYYSASFYDGAQKYNIPATQTVLSGGKVVLPTAAPTKAGYTFDKWVTTNGGTTAFDFNIAITSTTNIYAKWLPKTDTPYKVNHYQAAVDGNYSADPTVEPLTGTTGDTTSAVAKTYEGFTAEPFTQGVILANGSTVVNIYYKRNLYDITFVIDPSKATVTGDITPEVAYGATPTAPDITAKPGYTFTGWDPTIASVTSDATYTAVFAANATYSISYNLDGGTVAISNPVSYSAENNDFTLTNPTKTGYTFAGWTGTGLASLTDTVKVETGSTGDRTYTATWTADRYAVTFDANGGQYADDATTAAVNQTYGNPYELPSANPNRSGYTFGSWNVQPDGEGTTVTATTNVTVTVTHNVYAVWAEVGNVAINYAANDTTYGTVSRASESFNPEIGTALGSVATANADYHFVEWQDANGTQVSTSTTFVPQQVSGVYVSETYTAIFAANTDTAYTVEHFVMDQYGNYPANATKISNKTGTTNGNLTLENLMDSSLLVHDGITYAYGSADNINTANTTIKPDGTRVIKLYYARSQYELTLSTGTGTLNTTGGGTYYYGQPISINVMVDSDYAWDKWQSSNSTFLIDQVNQNASFAMPAGNVTLSAQAIKSSTGNYIVIGTVVDDDTSPVNVPGATVEIVKGSTRFGDVVVTDAGGQFTIHNVPAGIYNLKITLGEKTAIIAVTIGGDTQVVQLGNIIFPYNASSALKLKGSGTPAIVIDNLHPEAVDYLFNDYGNTGFAKVELVIKKIDETISDADALEAINRIKKKAQNGNVTIGLYLDMIVEKFYRVTEAISWQSEGLIGQTNGLIKVIIPIPQDLQGKSKYMVYRYHGNEVNIISTAQNTDGEYLVLDKSNWTLTLYVKNFSVYAIVYDNPVAPPIIEGTTDFEITFDADGGTPSSITQSVAIGNLLTKPVDPERVSYTFVGWYKADGSEWNFSTEKVYSNLKLKAKWVIANKDIPALDKVNHFAYMKGYPDKTFVPQKNMTRAEVTVMFSRLLVKKMDVDKNYSSKFKDIDSSKWYANAIGYMEQYGIITGYSDGTFKPDATITRAEFAAIASRFDKLITGEHVIFTDVSENHWARDYISFANAKGWVKGYQEGTFKPQNFITRAEVVSLVNRMLERYGDRSYVDNNQGNLNQYVDLTISHWAYYDIMEATKAHDYEKTSNGETWIRHTK